MDAVSQALAVGEATLRRRLAEEQTSFEALCDTLRYAAAREYLEMTDLPMSEISAASTEQSAGVTQIGEAVMQMDQVTQQNAALVEEMAAAASSLKLQAHELVQSVAAFNTGAPQITFATVEPVKVRAADVGDFKGPERRATFAAKKGGPAHRATGRFAPKQKAAVAAAPAASSLSDEWTSF